MLVKRVACRRAVSQSGSGKRERRWRAATSGERLVEQQLAAEKARSNWQLQEFSCLRDKER